MHNQHLTQHDWTFQCAGCNKPAKRPVRGRSVSSRDYCTRETQLVIVPDVAMTLLAFGAIPMRHNRHKALAIMRVACQNGGRIKPSVIAPWAGKAIDL